VEQIRQKCRREPDQWVRSVANWSGMASGERQS